MPKSKIKGGGTKKVCLPYAKYRSMSKAERQKVIRAKRTAAAQGKYRRSSKSNVKGARKKGATLREWFNKKKGMRQHPLCEQLTITTQTIFTHSGSCNITTQH